MSFYFLETYRVGNFFPENLENATRRSLFINFSFLKKYFIYLFLAVLGLHCCVGFSLSCEEQGLLSSCSAQVSRCSGFSCCRAQASVVAARGLRSCGSWALEQELNSCGARASFL